MRSAGDSRLRGDRHGSRSANFTARGRKGQKVGELSIVGVVLGDAFAPKPAAPRSATISRVWDPKLSFRSRSVAHGRWLTTFAPILISFSRRLVSDHGCAVFGIAKRLHEVAEVIRERKGSRPLSSSGKSCSV